MTLLSIFFIAIALSLDAFTVSMCSGMTIHDLRFRHILKISLCFGIFQAVMPLLGYLAGIRLYVWIESFDHWVAFALLSGVGVKMIWDSVKVKESCHSEKEFLDTKLLLILGVATSIDAMAVGLAFAMSGSPILIPSLIIGGVTFLISFLGVLLGERFGDLFKGHVGIVGGLILIAIGSRILYQHLMHLA